MNDPKMTDVISRRAVLDRLEMLRWNYSLKAGYRDAMTDAIGEVSNALTIDAAPVVRCKDCAHWKPCEVKGFEGNMYCEWAGWLVGENAYCVYGEVKDDD